MTRKPQKSDSCETPDWLYKALDAEFRFDLDPCPLARIPKFDGLKINWDGRRVFCNPPYSDILPWVRKALSSSCLVVFLVPARMDSEWSRALRESGAELRPFARSVSYAGLDAKPHHPLGGSMVAVVRRLYPSARSARNARLSHQPKGGPVA